MFNSNVEKSNLNIDWKLVLIFLLQIILAVIVGNRDLSIGTDTLRYSELYQSIQDCQCFMGKTDPGFQTFTFLFGLTELGSGFYFFGISMTLFLTLNIVVKKLELIADYTKKHRTTLFYFILLSTLLSPFFVSAHINAIRQGMSAFFIFYALLAASNKEWKGFIFSSILAFSFHYTAIIYLAIFPLIYLPIYRLLSILSLVSLLYATGGSEVLISWISKKLGLGLYDSIIGYQKNVSYESGVRYDFLIFSLLWIGIVVIVDHFVLENKYRKVVNVLLKVYIVLLVPFLLFGFASFSNRYAYTAWLFLPILLATTVWSIPVINKLKRMILTSMVIFSPIVFMLMVLNGFAK